MGTQGVYVWGGEYGMGVSMLAFMDQLGVGGLALPSFAGVWAM
jgi:hypothetical protein